MSLSISPTHIAMPRLDLMSDTMYFKYLYLPFVLVEVIWDYADSLCNMAAQLRIPELKCVSRGIRELRQEYERDRKRLSFKYRKSDESSMVFFQDIFEKEINSEYNLIRWKVQHELKDLDPKYLDFLTTAHFSRAFSLAVTRYCTIADKELEKVWGSAPHSILGPVAKAMIGLLSHFAGDQQSVIKYSDINASANRLCDYMKQTKHSGQFKDMDELRNHNISIQSSN